MSVAVQDLEQISGPEIRRWTVSDYERAAEAGVFGPEERLELIEGEIYRMSPQNAPHTTAVGKTLAALSKVFRKGHHVRVQMPLHLGDTSLPEPDICVITGSWDDYARRQPTTAVLVVEASDSSISFDLIKKAALYAGTGIQEYWVLAIPERVLVVHREPDPATRTYRSVVRLADTDQVSPLAAPKAVIQVATLWASQQ
jgi:Uma2 family endonuclease